MTRRKEIVSDARRVAALLAPLRRRDMIRIIKPLLGLNPRSRPRVGIVLDGETAHGFVCFVLADDRRTVGLCLRTEVEKLDRRARGALPGKRAGDGPMTAGVKASIRDFFGMGRMGGNSMNGLMRCLHEDICRDGRMPDPAEKKRLAAHVAEVAEMLATQGVVRAALALSAPKPDRMMRIGEVMRISGLSYATLWRHERAGKFPRRRKTGIRAVGWLESEVTAWLAGRSPLDRR